MSDTASEQDRRNFAAAALTKPLAALAEALPGARRADDVEHVHRTRVASRRLRNVLELFEDAWPPEQRKSWRKRIRGITRTLGAARDLDVQITFLETALAGLRGHSAAAREPGVRHVLRLFRNRRRKAQADVIRAVDRVERQGVLHSMARWVRDAEPPSPSPALVVLAARTVLARLAAARSWERYLDDPARSAELHALRIAVKHLRYTLEVFEPLFAGGLATQIAWCRQAQDLLGEIHDCDVWLVELPRLRAALGSRATARAAAVRRQARLRPGVDYLIANRRRRRRRLYRNLLAHWPAARDGRRGTWASFTAPFDAALAGAPLPAPVPALLPESSQLAPVLRLAEHFQYEAGHCQQVTRLALRLFDELAPLHRLDRQARYWLAAAGLLHDIGWAEGRAGHHKTALRMILDTQRLRWNLRTRRIVGLVARYHRGRLPDERHADYAALGPDDRATVRRLAALLRVADGLDYRHADTVRELRCRVDPRRITILCQVREPADLEADRAEQKAELAATEFKREVRVRWRLRGMDTPAG